MDRHKLRVHRNERPLAVPRERGAARVSVMPPAAAMPCPTVKPTSQRRASNVLKNHGDLCSKLPIAGTLWPHDIVVGAH
jgi:hypothetical protein